MGLVDGRPVIPPWLTPHPPPPPFARLVYPLARAAAVYDLAARTSRPLCTCRFAGAAWNRGGVILIGAGGAGYGPIRRLTLTDREPRDVTTVDAAKREQDTLPVFLPDGRRFLFTRSTAGSSVGTYVLARRRCTEADRRRIAHPDRVPEWFRRMAHGCRRCRARRAGD